MTEGFPPESSTIFYARWELGKRFGRRISEILVFGVRILGREHEQVTHLLFLCLEVFLGLP